MEVSMRKNILLVLLISFICRFAQDLFNPYISLNSFTNWRLWAVIIVDAVILTIGLIIGGVFYKGFKKQGRNRILIIAITLFICFLVYTFIQQKIFLEDSALSIITIVIAAAWKTGLFVAGVIIFIGMACFIYEKVKKKE
ncbi:MAG: hypothetical protein MSE26_09140 [Lachnospiraceae bacterium]|nr:hypothetical protein [Lachnospiraceae bacterium]MDD6979253.1 hypothetical protein [Bacillota bacterium]MDY6173630.1 hypothetical protein [Lentihominibacter sp.]